jgi:hypothetical protein
MLEGYFHLFLSVTFFIIIISVDVFFKKKDAEKQSINYNWPGLKVTECILT